jgi:DNA-binding transcriptional MerR regulator
MARFVTISVVARKLGVMHYQINYAQKTGKIPKPRKIGGHRLYDIKTIALINDYFTKRRKK